MFRILCKSKIHRATLTGANLHYSGSIAVDEALMEAADILPNEMVLVVNLKNAKRFETYVIPAKKNSGAIGLQGGAALLGKTGDKLIIMSNCLLEDRKARAFKPKHLYLGKGNKPL